MIYILHCMRTLIIQDFVCFEINRKTFTCIQLQKTLYVYVMCIELNFKKFKTHTQNIWNLYIWLENIYETLKFNFKFYLIIYFSKWLSFVIRFEFFFFCYLYSWLFVVAYLTSYELKFSIFFVKEFVLK